MSMLQALALILPAFLEPTQDPAPPPPKTPESTKVERVEPRPVGVNDPPAVTRHEIPLDGKPLKYTATAGYLPIKSEATGEAEAHIFYIAYTLRDAPDAAKRPLTFSFNGGPGSASVWLHLGAIGPKRVAFPDSGDVPGPPFRLVDNASTWLGESDLVFIDPVGTGYSRAAKPELTRKFHGLQGDLDSVAEFIRLYLARNGRWTSPLYVVGESYGTTRAAGLSDRLIERGIALNGVMLISTVLNFQTIRPAKGNDLPFALYLPTFTATAWYHKKLAPDLQSKPARDVLAEASAWAEGDYALALMEGDRLPAGKRSELARQLARYTGLDPVYVERSNFRIDPTRFRKELLRDRAKTVGRLDSRFLGVDELASTERPEDDPSQSAIRPAYTSTFNQYIRADLGFATDLPYFILGEGVAGWDYGPSNQGFADTSDALRDAMAKNPHLKVLVASGYYDLATPFRAAEYTLAHMGLDPAMRANIRVEEYESGHMMYLHGPSLAKLKGDVAAFFRDTQSR